MQLKLHRIGGSEALIIPSDILKKIREELLPDEKITGLNIVLLNPVIKKEG